MKLPRNAIAAWQLTIILTASSVVAAQESPNLEGTWQGSLRPGGLTMRLIVHLARKSDGSYTATMDSPDQGVDGIPVSGVFVDQDQVRLEVKAVQGEFSGKPSADHSEIEGQWKQAGITLPLKLSRMRAGEEVKRSNRPQEPKKPYPYLEREVRYENRQDKVVLAGTITLPNGKGPHAAVILISGSGPQNRDEFLLGHRPFLVLADYLTRRGIAVLRVDDRGTGKSTGDFATATTEDFARDVRAGVEFLRTRPEINPRKIGLMGHSEGGLIAPMVAVSCPDVAFIVLLAGPGLPGEDILYLQGEKIARAMGAPEGAIAFNKRVQQAMISAVTQEADKAKAEGRIKAAVGELVRQLDEVSRRQAQAGMASIDGQIRTFNTPWFRYFLTFDPRPTLAKVKCPVLAIIGEKDLQVPVRENLIEIRQALVAGKNEYFTVKELPGLNHLFQTCKTGSPAEYSTIEETFSPKALELIGSWIGERVGQRAEGKGQGARGQRAGSRRQ